MDWQAAVAIPTFVCSLLSAVATGLVISLWASSKDESKKYSFRYALVMNLTLAEFINSTNNTISGSFVIANQRWLSAGPSCVANGFIGQLSVLAADFSILAIAVVTLLSVNFNPWIIHATRKRHALVCLSTWVVPLITAIIALASGKLQPVTGNWCWIPTDPLWLRYALTHGWRFAIFIAVIGMYTSVFIDLRQRLAHRNKTAARHSFSLYTNDTSDVNAMRSNLDTVIGHSASSKPAYTRPQSPESQLSKERGGRSGSLAPPNRSRTFVSEFGKEANIHSESSLGERRHEQERLGIKPRLRIIQSSELDKETRHFLFLSFFPLAYIICWVPGIANRLAELVGSASGEWLTAIQAITQLTGLVNAVVYGIREHRDVLYRKKKKRDSNQWQRDTDTSQNRFGASQNGWSRI